VRRREIADAALRIIADKGLGRFTALAIAREIGITDGALFRHFATKEEIVLAAIDRVEEILFEGFPPAREDPLERLGAFFQQRVEAIAQHPGVSRLVHSEDLARAGPPAGVKRLAGFKERSSGFVRACLEEAASRGLLAKDVGVGEAQVLVMGAIMALALSPRVAAPGGRVERLAGRVWGVLERLLRGRGASSPRRRGS